MLCAHGDRDEIVPYEQGEELSTALGANFVTLPRAGHNDVLHDPHWERFARQLETFVNAPEQCTKENKRP